MTAAQPLRPPTTTAAPVPPQNLEAEESVLGAMMVSGGAIDAVIEIVNAADFYRASHGLLFAALAALHLDGKPADAITVAEELDRQGHLKDAGGKARVFDLASLVPPTANVRHYATIVREAALRRDVIKLSSEAAGWAWNHDGDATEIIERVQEAAFALSRSDRTGAAPPIAAAVREAYDRLVELHERGGDIIGVPTGYRKLDYLTAGLQPGDLIVIAARPSMGKSALAAGIISHVTLNLGRPVVLFTLEMSRQQMIHRLISHHGFVDLHKLRTGKLGVEDWERVTNAISQIERAPLYIDDTGSASMLELRARARRQKLQNPDLALIVIDYLQLMTSGERSENRVQDVSRITRGLKLLARDLDTPVLAMSQLSRSVEQRHDKRPILSDLRESGSVEQDADVVMFVYREEYYEPEDPEVAGLAEINIAKQRNGPTGLVKLAFVADYARFSELALPGVVG